MESGDSCQFVVVVPFGSFSTEFTVLQYACTIITTLAILMENEAEWSAMSRQ